MLNVLSRIVAFPEWARGLLKFAPVIRSIAVHAAVVALPSLGVASRQAPFSTDVFISGRGGYHAYRIPAMVVFPQGSLVVFCEARKSSLSDDGDIDLLSRRSEDGGKTWLAPQLVIEEGGEARIKYGNPTTVVDQETGTIWLAINRDYLDERGGRQGGTLILMSSDDDGKSWSSPIDITSQTKKPSWKHYAFGPGIGIQLRHGPHKGRLILPANYRESFNKREPSWSHIVHSDDHGETWKVGGKLGKYTNECQVVEITEDGKPGLLFNARNHWGRAGVPQRSGKRLASRSLDGGLTWSQEEMDPALSDPPCQASIFRYSWATDGHRSRILFSNPAGPGRTNLTIRLSYDEGRTWPVEKLVYGGSAAYSCLTRLPDGKIGVVYERDGYGKLTFTSFALDWLDADNAP
jgi:sialidase-1